jgi:hypothetical protein
MHPALDLAIELFWRWEGLLDKLYEAEWENGSRIPFVFFERFALLSWKQVAMNVRQAIGESLTVKDLRRMGARGWIPILHNPHDSKVGIGFPLYTPWRIKLLLELERDGYAADELQAIAKWEEVTINFYFGAALPSINDGLHLDRKDLLVNAELDGRAALLTLLKERVPYEQFEKKHRCTSLQTDPVDRYIVLLDNFVFRCRAISEIICGLHLELDRGLMRAGYSPFVNCKKNWSFGDISFDITPQGIDWDAITFPPVVDVKDETPTDCVQGIDWNTAIRIAIAYAKDDIPMIRVPGFLVHGDLVRSTRTLTPREYELLWKQYDLDRYLLTWSALRGEKRCLHCLSQLFNRRMYCNDKCRNAWKQKQYRRRHPEAIFETQRRYWSTLGEEFARVEVDD